MIFVILKTIRLNAVFVAAERKKKMNKEELAIIAITILVIVMITNIPMPFISTTTSIIEVVGSMG